MEKKKEYYLHHRTPKRAGRWSYVIRNGAVQLENASCNRDEIVVPEWIDGRPVTALAGGCFAFMDMVSVWLPVTLERIGMYAFDSCEELEAVVVPESVNCIDETAFSNSPDVCLYVQEGSYAHRYAQRLGLAHEFSDPDTSALAENNIVCGAYTYAVMADDTAVIREYNGTEELVVIPDELDGYPVTLIASRCFSGNETLQEVIVPQGVRTLGACAFSDCTKLKTVVLPESVAEIGASCFFCCESLRYIVLPDEIECIGFMCFAGCKSLVGVFLPSALREIEPMAFSGCRSLERLNLPAHLETVADSAFSGCSALRKPDFPLLLDEESRQAFRHCSEEPGDTEESPRE